MATEGQRGPLEGELYRELEEAATQDPVVREALASEGGRQVSPDDLMRIIAAKQAALERAVLRLARELDRR